jgi:hypothetical protein
VQLVEGLGSPGVEFGVDQVRSLAFVYPGRYRLAGGCVHHRSSSWTWVNRSAGVSVQMSERQ